MSQLPKGWKIKMLDEVSRVVNGGTPKTKIEEYWSGSHYWITPAEMGKRNSPYVSETKRTLTDAGLQNCSAQLVPPLSVILSTRAPIGHLVINTEPMASNQGCRSLVPSKKLYYKFLFYFLLSRVEHLNDLGTGATFKELSAGNLKGFLIPLPPLPEQKRIVSILDEVFAKISKAVANAEKNLANARELFESILQSAIEGKFSPEASIEGFVEDHLEELESKSLPVITEEEIPFSLPKYWRWIRLGSIAKFINGDRGKNYPNKKEYVLSGIPWINTGHIHPDGSLSVESMNYITKEKFDLLRSGKIEKGDLVYCLRGATIGKTAFVVPYTKGAVASSLVIIRPENVINRKYLYYFLTSPFGQKLIKRFDNGAAQPNLGANSVKKYITPLPPMSEQIAIIKKLDALSSNIQHVETIYREKLTALTKLKQSVLQKAFAGELTADAIRQQATI